MRSPAEPQPPSGLRIGEVAALTGVTTRTLRYYEELGLIAPCNRTESGQERRYTEEEVARVQRIRELQDVLGSGLSEIREAMAAEDRMDDLRQAFRQSTSPKEQILVLEEAVEVIDRQLAQVDRRQERLQRLRAELEARRQRHLAKLSALRGDPAPSRA